jgi:light-regulated signal transduction histidine kinase (bacteriophytochrome)
VRAGRHRRRRSGDPGGVASPDPGAVLHHVRRIVEDRHDGSISFDTGADGTTFHVWLPITGAAPSLARAEDTNNEETPR